MATPVEEGVYFDSQLFEEPRASGVRGVVVVVGSVVAGPQRESDERTTNCRARRTTLTGECRRMLSSLCVLVGLCRV